MSEEKPSLHIDNDWKRQAQEEKKRLAEQEAQKVAAPSAATTGSIPGAPPDAHRPASGARGRAMPESNFAGLVQSMMTQTLFYLGDLAARGAEPQINLDMAKHQIDTLGVLEEKTRNNLTDEEKKLLDTALYEVRMRYVAVASQYT